MSSPKVSVLMSVLNGEHYLREAIESILHQSFTDFEFIIIDDGSTDCTSVLLAEYASQDSRFVIIHNEENIGLTRSLNKGLAVAKGEYVARQDADDVSLPQRLQKQVNFLDNHPEVVLVSGNYQIVDEQGCEIKKVQKFREPVLIAWFLLFVNYIGRHSIVMFRREQVLSIGGYAETYRYAQDYQLWLRLVNMGDIVILPEILLCWRSHTQSISVKLLSEQTQFAVKASQDKLKQLTGLDFTLAETMELRYLWSSYQLPNRRINRLHANLRIIYHAFLAQCIEQGYDGLTLSRQLRSLISRHLLFCGRSSCLAKTVWLKLVILPYALTWDAKTVLGYWLRIFKYFLIPKQQS